MEFALTFLIAWGIPFSIILFITGVILGIWKKRWKMATSAVLLFLAIVIASIIIQSYQSYFQGKLQTSKSCPRRCGMANTHCITPTPALARNQIITGQTIEGKRYTLVKTPKEPNFVYLVQDDGGGNPHLVWPSPIPVNPKWINSFWYSPQKNKIFIVERYAPKFAVYNFEEVEVFWSPTNWQKRTLAFRQEGLHSHTYILKYYPQQDFLLLQTSTGNECEDHTQIWGIQKGHPIDILKPFIASCSRQTPRRYLGFNGRFLFLMVTPSATDKNPSTPTLERIEAFDPLTRRTVWAATNRNVTLWGNNHYAYYSVRKDLGGILFRIETKSKTKFYLFDWKTRQFRQLKSVPHFSYPLGGGK